MPDSGRLPAVETPPKRQTAGDAVPWHEWPTWMLVCVIYSGWLTLTWFSQSLPWWLVLPLGAWLVAWQNSLQHEALHGHPSGYGWLNDALAWPPLGLWMPYGIYRDSHRAHHATPALTDPLDDPESCYVTPAAWAGLGLVRRALLWANNTLAGRLTIGPWLAAERFWRAEAGRLLAGDFSHLYAWIVHLVLVGGLLAWLILACGMSLADYVLLFAWPGLSLTLMRSFHEHRPAADQARRTTILEAGPLAALLYLNNNLHLVHHDRPDLPWYRMPALYRRDRAALIARNGGFLVTGGYLEIALRYGLHPKDSPVHPG